MKSASAGVKQVGVQGRHVDPGLPGTQQQPLARMVVMGTYGVEEGAAAGQLGEGAGKVAAHDAGALPLVEAVDVVWERLGGEPKHCRCIGPGSKQRLRLHLAPNAQQAALLVRLRLRAAVGAASLHGGASAGAWIPTQLAE